MRSSRMLLALALAAHAFAGSPLGAQSAAVQADTIRGSRFSDGIVAEAFGLPNPTEAHTRLAREKMQCFQAEDAILCNLAAPGSAWKDCANTALVGHFIVWFDLLRGQPTDKRAYVAVECSEATVTVTSLRQFPAIEFTLATRPDGSTEEESRTVVFIQSN